MAAESVAIIPIRDDQPTPMNVIQLAISQGADVEKLTRLFELQERWEANEARKAFNAAMAQFKQNPPQITKNKHVKFGSTEYDHATLDHVTEQVTKALSAVGISHKWSVKQEGKQISVSCILTHEMGHSETTTLTADPDSSGSKNSIQAIGSAVTYLERYTLLAATGLAAAEDDDGQAAAEPMVEAEVVKYLDWIKDAKDDAELQKYYLAALKLAEEAKDGSAKNAFVKAKNERYRQLHPRGNYAGR